MQGIGKIIPLSVHPDSLQHLEILWPDTGTPPASSVFAQWSLGGAMSA